jgi:hypothetical protein
MATLLMGRDGPALLIYGRHRVGAVLVAREG